MQHARGVLTGQYALACLQPTLTIANKQDVVGRTQPHRTLQQLLILVTARTSLTYTDRPVRTDPLPTCASPGHRLQDASICCRAQDADRLLYEEATAQQHNLAYTQPALYKADHNRHSLSPQSNTPRQLPVGQGVWHSATHAQHPITPVAEAHTHTMHTPSRPTSACKACIENTHSCSKHLMGHMTYRMCQHRQKPLHDCTHPAHKKRY